MTKKEAYDHGYDGTLTLAEILEQFPPRPHCDEVPPQLDSFVSGVEDKKHDADSDEAECNMEPDDFMTDGEADADALASAGYGTDEDYGFYG